MTEKADADRRQFVRLALYAAAGTAAGSLFVFGPRGASATNFSIDSSEDLRKFEWGFLVDTSRCIGCGSCVRACSVENNVPDGYYRTWIERYEIEKNGTVHVDSPKGAIESFHADTLGPETIAKAFFVPKLCNHCVNSACTQVCPVGATFHSPDGVVLIDKEHCVGCGYCVQACPYGTRYIDHERGTADKCTLCYHRIHKGLSPACVTACPREARIFGNLKDPESRINKILRQRRYHVLKPEMGTNPKCFYIGLDKEVI